MQQYQNPSIEDISNMFGFEYIERHPHAEDVVLSTINSSLKNNLLMNILHKRYVFESYIRNVVYCKFPAPYDHCDPVGTAFTWRGSIEGDYFWERVKNEYVGRFNSNIAKLAGVWGC